MNEWANRFIAQNNAQGKTVPPPVWPFPTKSKKEYRRIDQGWDLQYPGTNPVPIRATESGTLHMGSDPKGFGPSYPIIELDQPIGGHSGIYYGHTFVDKTMVGQHVKRGQIIGHTGGSHSGGNAFPDPNFLEIGFWPPGSMGAGSQMKTFLLGGKAVGGNTPTQGPNPSTNVLPCPSIWDSIFGGVAGITAYYACHRANAAIGNSFLGRFAADPVDYLERAGLILLGAALVVLGFIIIATSPVRQAAKEGTQTLAAIKGLGGGGAKKPGLSPEQQADRQRRLTLAEQNAAIGERRVGIAEKKEARLRGVQDF